MDFAGDREAAAGAEGARGDLEDGGRLAAFVLGAADAAQFRLSNTANSTTMARSRSDTAATTAFGVTFGLDMLDESSRNSSLIVLTSQS